MKPATREVIDAHGAAGRALRGRRGSELRPRAGQRRGGAVVLVHGVPSSSFLYRKVLPALADAGPARRRLRPPGPRPRRAPDDFDYSWSGLARWLGEAIDALGLDRCPPRRPRHRRADRLRVGGPEPRARALADGAQHDARPGDLPPAVVDGAVRDPRARRRLAARRRRARSSGGSSSSRASPTASPITAAEIDAYYDLLRRGDGGRAFLRIMRGFELTADKRRFLWAGLAKRPYPARIVWGELDPALGLDQLDIAQRVLGADDADPPSGEALPPGGPGAGGRSGDRRPGGAARLGAGPEASSAAPAPLDQGRARPARGSGISTRSKSRGAIAPGHRLSRLRKHGADVVARRDVDDGEHLDLGLAGDDRGLARRRVPGFGGSLRLLVGEAPVVDQQLGAVGGDRASSRRAPCRR